MIISSRNNYVFKGHRALLGGKFVTYGELEFKPKYELFDKSDTFDWGQSGVGAQQLAFSILTQIANEEFAKENYSQYTEEVIKELNSRDWILTGSEVVNWIRDNSDFEEETQSMQNQILVKKKKVNVVKKVCNELDITQKTLANILEVPEGTVSSWAVKNEIPRLGKKAIEFYIEKQKNQKIVDSYKSFVNLLNAS